MLILWSVQFNFGFNSRARAQTVQWHSTETVVSRLTCFKLHGTMVSNFKNRLGMALETIASHTPALAGPFGLNARPAGEPMATDDQDELL